MSLVLGTIHVCMIILYLGSMLTTLNSNTASFGFSLSGCILNAIVGDDGNQWGKCPDKIKRPAL